MVVYSNKKGQSLIEVVVAVGMIGMLLVAILALITLSLKNSRLAKAKTQAVALAQEGVELMRTYRDLSWTGLVAKADGNSYSLPLNWTINNSLTDICPVTFNINNLFRRCLVLSDATVNSVLLTVTVEWQEGNRWHQSQQATRLALW